MSLHNHHHYWWTPRELIAAVLLFTLCFAVVVLTVSLVS